MSGDPLVAHFARESHRTHDAWQLAVICQLWIWLNAAAALGFRFWVVDRFDFTSFVEERLWPGFFLLESLLQLCVVLAVCVALVRTPRSRNFWVFAIATLFCLFVDGIILLAWGSMVFTEEYRMAATFGLFGCYLTIPAIFFALYCAVVSPSSVSLWVYAVSITIALKCSAIILPRIPSQTFVSYTLIIVIALLSIILPLRFGFRQSRER